MSDTKIILVVLAATFAAVVVVGLFKRSTRKHGYGDQYRDEKKRKETEDRSKGS